MKKLLDEIAVSCALGAVVTVVTLAVLCAFLGGLFLLIKYLDVFAGILIFIIFPIFAVRGIYLLVKDYVPWKQKK